MESALRANVLTFALRIGVVVGMFSLKNSLTCARTSNSGVAPFLFFPFFPNSVKFWNRKLK